MGEISATAPWCIAMIMGRLPGEPMRAALEAGRSSLARLSMGRTVPQVLVFRKRLFRENRSCRINHELKRLPNAHGPSPIRAEIMADEVLPANRLPGLARSLTMLCGFHRRRGEAGEAIVGEADRIGFGDFRVERQR